MISQLDSYFAGVRDRLDRITEFARGGGLDCAIDIMVNAIQSGGILHAFGTGHSEAFAMEIAGRAGGLIPTHQVTLRDLVLKGGADPSILTSGILERDESVANELFRLTDARAADAFLIASNSGVNGSIVGYALAAKRLGHPLIAVTSFAHTADVTPKHSSGKRLREIADVAIDNLAPYGDATLPLGSDIRVGSVSSITAAYIAQLLTIGAAERLSADGAVPPIYLSANIPGGDDHNRVLEERYLARYRA